MISNEQKTFFSILYKEAPHGHISTALSLSWTERRFIHSFRHFRKRMEKSSKVSRWSSLSSFPWLASSWYYQLRLADHLPADLGDHVFLSLFLTVVFGFGCVLSIFAVFVFGSIAISSALHSNGSQKKGGPNHSPLPLWIVSLAVGLLSVWILNKNMIPQLTRLMDQLIDLIYVKLFQSKAQFVSSYIPVAGIAAGSIVPFCLNKLYRNSRVPFLYYPFVVLVPALTAVLAPLVDLLGCVLVNRSLPYVAYCEKDGRYSSHKRPAWLYFLDGLRRRRAVRPVFLRQRSNDPRR